MTLSDYIIKRNGVPAGSPHSLRNNLYRSLGAKNFSVFWNYWNPVFGYYLGMYVFKPIKKFFPSSAAIIFTFVICGMFHDIIISVVRGKISVFFTLWFLIMGTGVLINRYFRYDLSERKWILRALMNLGIVISCLLLTIYLLNYLIPGINNIF
ncbi:MAG: acyltransferase [Bacteroidetes bacterium]|nr:acyltransferase [Bacteroidota bacterium]